MILPSKPAYMFPVSDSYENAAPAYHLSIGDGLYLKQNGNFSESVQHPGYQLLIAIGFVVFGISDTVVMGVSILSALGIILITYLLGKEFFTPKVGLIASILLLLSPLFLMQSVAGQGDITATFFLILSIYTILVFIRTKKYIFFSISMFAFNFAFLSRYQYVLIGIVLLYIIIQEYLQNKSIKLFKCLIIFLTFFIIIIVPFLYFNYISHGDIFPRAYSFYNEKNVGADGVGLIKTDTISSHFYQLLSYILLNSNFHESVMWYSVIFSLLFLFGIFYLFKSKDKKVINILGLWIIVFIIFFSGFILIEVRYLFPLLIPIVLIISNLLVAADKINYRISYLFLLILIIGSVSPIQQEIGFIKQRHEWSWIKDAGVFINQNTPKDAVILSILPYEVDFYAQRDVYDFDTVYPEGNNVYAIQVNEGYIGFDMENNIPRSYYGLVNLSKTKKLLKTKVNPTFILYQVK